MRISASSTAKVVEHFGHRTMVSFDQAQVQPDARTAQTPMIEIKVASFLILLPPYKGTLLKITTFFSSRFSSQTGGKEARLILI
jgi:hypothetical protein